MWIKKTSKNGSKYYENKFTGKEEKPKRYRGRVLGIIPSHAFSFLTQTKRP